MIHPFEQIILEFLDRYHLADQELLLGFSGGADSTALLLMLQNTGRKFRAVHFEHGIRGEEALRDASWCRRFCEQRSIPFECHSLQVPEHALPGEGIEAAARRLRLEKWLDISDGGKRPVLLAHHQDDCLENFFLRLGRGAGSSGLTGLREFRRLGRLRLYRPMLSVRRAQLEDYLQEQGVGEWCCDSTNLDVAYRRNAVRRELMPLWRRIFGGDFNVSWTMQILSEEAQYLEEQAAELLPGLISLRAWRAVPAVLLSRVLRLWWQRRTGEERLFNRKDIAALAQAFAEFDGGNRKLELSGKATVIISKAGIHICEKAVAVQKRLWNWQETPRLELPEIGCVLQVLQKDEAAPPKSELFSRNSLQTCLQIRSWQKGDRIRPFGAPFHKKLQDLWNEAEIPAEKRLSVPILLNAGEIIWVPGVRRAEFGRVAGDEPAVRLCLLRKQQY